MTDLNPQDLADLSVEIVAFGTILTFVTLLIALRCLDRSRRRVERERVEEGHRTLGDRDDAELPQPSVRDSWRVYRQALSALQ